MTVSKESEPVAPGGGGLAFWIVGFILLVAMPLLNVLPPEDSWLHLSDFSLNRFGKFLAFAILALGLDLIWGYTGILSLGQGVFFGLGAYCMGMHMMLTIGKESVYGSDLPDFMVWNQVKELPLFWKPFYSFPIAVIGAILVPMLFALVFGFFAFRSRIKGVYFAIITQALALAAWLVFNRNDTNLGGTNGLTDFKQLIGYRLSDPGTQRHGALSRHGLSLVPLGDSLSGRTRAGRRAGQRTAGRLFRVHPGHLQIIRLCRGRGSRRIGRDALCPSGRHHHTGANRGTAVA
jgi:urea transport system permease protein